MNPEHNFPKRPLAPKALSRFDQWLLKNYPDTWSARTHMVLYYALLFAAAFYAICLVMPDDPRSTSMVGLWVTAGALISGIGLIFWLVYLFRFNVFKRFGTLAPGDRLRNFLVFYLTIFVLTVLVYIPFVTEKQKADATFTDEEVIRDANDVNYCVGLLVKNSFELSIKIDTIILVGSSEEAEQKNAELRARNDGEPRANSTTYAWREQNDYEWRMAEADSVQKIDFNTYVLFTFTKLQHVAPWYSHYNEFSMEPESHSAYDDSRKRLFTTLDLYYLIYRDNPKYSEEEATSRIRKMNAKYRLPMSSWNYVINHNYYGIVEIATDGSNLSEYINRKYDTWSMDHAMKNIMSRKHRFDTENVKSLALFTFYFVLCQVLLLFAFRHSTVKTFFLSILAGIIIAILTGLFLAVTRFHERGILVVLLVYYAVFLAISVTIGMSRVRSLVKGIALNFTFWMTYFIPLIIVGLYYSWMHKLHPYRPDAPEEYDRVFANEDLHYALAQYGGAALLLISIAFLFSRWYRTWYSQPEE
ncbi:MAG: hypothetical protein FD123_445 [Bacteroidetes bacterium]|nr:MAG: hypothetical protein FD123_445 [Bacteroidota bacterium]